MRPNVIPVAVLLALLAPVTAATSPYLPSTSYLEYVHVKAAGSDGSILEVIATDASALNKILLPPGSKPEEVLLTPTDTYITYLRHQATSGPLSSLQPPSDQATQVNPSIRTETVDVTSVAATVGYESEQVTVPGSVQAVTLYTQAPSGDALYVEVQVPPGVVELPLYFPPGTSQIIVVGASNPRVYVQTNGKWLEIIPGPLATYVTSSSGSLSVAYAPNQYTLTVGWSGSEACEVLVTFDSNPVDVGGSGSVSVQLSQQSGTQSGSILIPVPPPVRIRRRF